MAIVLLCHLLLILIGLPLVWWGTSKLGRSNPSIAADSSRIVLRSLALSCSFAQSGVVAGYVGFVFPALPLLILWIWQAMQGPLPKGAHDQIRWSINSLLFFWIVFGGIYTATYFGIRGKRSAAVSRTRVRMWSTSSPP